MPSENSALASQPEKPQHYSYLKEFRTLQCPSFLQHKCTQHRPYTCFHWHFANQRRRRPIRRRDGTFNYSADKYCPKYDETTGSCPNGDECPLLHRTAGDTERRYHLRYYKTATCVHETDAKGHCTKNGPHCAFAHGAQDLRQPTYDVREMQAIEQGDSLSDSLSSTELSSSLEKERSLNDDPKWNDTNYVLANYKTEPCKRPPRLCRQGYACPQYHNNRDRRRNPKTSKYRSTPCPQVKHGDEWSDPAVCDGGDNCQYCHTRTEQQFHPEIYKSTKCNDMVQTGYCPRGPFCAFAHVEQEMQLLRDALDLPKANSLGAFLPDSLQHDEFNGEGDLKDQDDLDRASNEENNNMTNSKMRVASYGSSYSDVASGGVPSPQLPEPIGKERSSSVSEYNRSVSLSDSYHRSNSVSEYSRHSNGLIEYQRQASIAGELSPREQDELSALRRSLSEQEHETTSKAISKPRSQSYSATLTGNSLNSSNFPNPFYPGISAVEPFLATNVDDLTLEDFNLAFIDKDEHDQDRDTASVSSSLSGLASSYLSTSMSMPVTIPNSSDALLYGSYGSLSQTPPSPPLRSLTSNVQNSQPTRTNTHQEQVQSLSNQSCASKFIGFGCDLSHLVSPRSVQALSGTISNGGEVNGNSESHKLREELNIYKARLMKSEDSITQARNACDVWKREAEDAKRRAKCADEEKLLALRQCDEAINQSMQMKRDVDGLTGSSSIRFSKPLNDVSNASLGNLRQLQQQLQMDLEHINQLIAQQTAITCIRCQEQPRCMTLSPCNHHILCENCCNQLVDCPLCRVRIQRRSKVMPRIQQK